MSRPGRHAYGSERQIRGWVAESTQFSAADFGPALSFLETVGALVRPPASPGQPRSGHLATEADRTAEPHPGQVQAQLVLEICRQFPVATEERIAERLEELEAVPAEDLVVTLQRLADVDLVKLTRRGFGHPLVLVPRTARPFDEVDWIESQITAVLRARPEIGYTETDELMTWLAEAGVEFDDRLFQLALGNLLMAGRLQTPMPDRWEGPGPRPTWLVDPIIYTTG
jgi:hypothetical protein